MEIAWNLIYVDFKKIILQPGITPLNYILIFIIVKLLQVSITNAWKIMDLVFGGLTMTFLVKFAWEKVKPKKNLDFLIPTLLIISSLGLIYPLTSMTGEGPSVFFTVLGLYLWSKKFFIKASLFFILALLSKYTIYLVLPGIILWTILQWKLYSSKDRKKVVLAFLSFICIFFLYHALKNWGDIIYQNKFTGNPSLSVLKSNLLPFFLSLLFGAPIITTFAVINPSLKNIFWLAGLSSLLMLQRRYYYWHYPLQILPFWTLYFLSYKQENKLLILKLIILQIIFTISLFSLLPIYTNKTTIIPKHITQNESFAIDRVILQNYHGGKIGYYLNKRYDEPFPNYEISYLEPNWDFVIEDTEYVVIPFFGIPQQLLNYKQCNYIYYQQVGFNTIYRVVCNSSKTQ